MPCLFINTLFGYLISELSPTENRVKFSKGGGGVAVAWVNGTVIQTTVETRWFFTSKVHFWPLVYVLFVLLTQVKVSFFEATVF